MAFSIASHLSSNSDCSEKHIRNPQTGNLTVDSGRRFYDPDTGRWISRDPIGEKGGLSLYAFARNTPIMLFDVLGMYSPPGMGPGGDAIGIIRPPWRWQAPCAVLASALHLTLERYQSALDSGIDIVEWAVSEGVITGDEDLTITAILVLVAQKHIEEDILAGADDGYKHCRVSCEAAFMSESPDAVEKIGFYNEVLDALMSPLTGSGCDARDLYNNGQGICCAKKAKTLGDCKSCCSEAELW